MTEREWEPELVRIAAFSTGAKGGNPPVSGWGRSCPVSKRCSASPPKWAFGDRVRRALAHARNAGG